MGQHFTLGAGPVQIMGQHVLPRLYGCRRLWLQGAVVMAKSGRLELGDNILRTL